MLQETLNHNNSKEEGCSLNACRGSMVASWFHISLFGVYFWHFLHLSLFFCFPFSSLSELFFMCTFNGERVEKISKAAIFPAPLLQLMAFLNIFRGKERGRRRRQHLHFFI